jgi:hypothetical protein
MVRDATLLTEHAVTSRTESALDRWIVVSPWRAAVVFAIAYLVIQPALYTLIHILNDEPRIVTTRVDWLALAALAVAMGAIAGIAFHVSRKLAPRSWTRAWIEAGNASLSVSCVLAWDKLPGLNWVAWIAIMIFSATVCGLLFGSIVRIVSNSIAASSSPLLPP